MKNIFDQIFIKSHFSKYGLIYISFAVAILFLANALYLSSSITRHLIDEEIVVSVLENMNEQNSYGTNWANVEDVARYYPSNQYNFSSAIMLYKLIGFFDERLFNENAI